MLIKVHGLNLCIALLFSLPQPDCDRSGKYPTYLCIKEGMNGRLQEDLKLPETLTITVRAPPTAIEHDWQEPTVNNWVTWESIPDIIAVRTLLGVGVDITVNNETELITAIGSVQYGGAVRNIAVYAPDRTCCRS